MNRGNGLAFAAEVGLVITSRRAVRTRMRSEAATVLQAVYSPV